ncbi:hypothetical protein EIP91_010947 [Steccherinum ochraceum]|uniref:F-box domain-containing protein n=1 Tax=Steccherinum ochraceum TaxID=92696 RepID=A0A4R0R7V5_9APHY|nr:hypothetical protein EIP91_010947 [Steccherinum ochraceum]
MCSYASTIKIRRFSQSRSKLSSPPSCVTNDLNIWKGEMSIPPEDAAYQVHRLPSKLWDRIFSYCTSSTGEYIRSISLTTSAFRPLAQPLLFHSIRISCDCSLQNGRRRYTERTEKVSRDLDRLAFIASSDFAFAVRKVDVVVHTRDPPASSGTCDAEVVIDALFTIIPVLTHLTSLTLNKCRPSRSQLSQLTSLAELKTLLLIDCMVDANSFPSSRPSFNLESLRIQLPDNPSLEQTFRSTHSSWTYLLNNRLTQLAIPQEGLSRTFLAALTSPDSTAPKEFPNLWYLSMHPYSHSYPGYLDAFTKLPALQTIHFQRKPQSAGLVRFLNPRPPGSGPSQSRGNTQPGQDDIVSLPKGTLPRLEHVSAPLFALRTFRETSSLKTIDVCEPADSAEALVQLQAMSGLQNVVAVTMRLKELGSGALVATVLESFRQLRNCDVRVWTEGGFSDVAAKEVRSPVFVVCWNR